MTHSIENKQIICKNCNNTYVGKYCNMCSQEAHTVRLSWKEILLHQLPHAIWHVDNGLFYTIKELFLRPGHTMRDYFEGKRVRHFNPFLFLLLMGSLFIFLFSSGEIEMINKEINLEKISHYSHSLAHYYYVFPFLYFAILLTISDYFLYRHEKFNSPELAIFNTFCLGQVLVIIILSVPILHLQQIIELHYDIHITIRPYIKLIIILFLIFSRIQLLWEKGNFLVFIKIILQILILYFSYYYLSNKIIESVLTH